MFRVLLLYHNPLFAHSIAMALRAQPQISLVGQVNDWAHAEDEICQLAPDVVIVEEDQRDATEGMLRALRTRSAPWRVVGLRLDETAMHIWSGTCRPINRVEDFIHALWAQPES
jgi:chemotaxis response regulator CheB